jgi:7,8-dihydroneopterin aldolase/epimerase/oxygenase
MQQDRIRIQNMVFFGYHGALAEEKALGQRFMLDVILYTDLQTAGKSDNLALTINYAEVYTVIKDIVEGCRFKLLEALGEAITEKILQHFSVTKVELNIRKPSAPVAGIFDFVEVSLVREQII